MKRSNFIIFVIETCSVHKILWIKRHNSKETFSSWFEPLSFLVIIAEWNEIRSHLVYVPLNSTLDLFVAKKKEQRSASVKSFCFSRIVNFVAVDSSRVERQWNRKVEHSWFLICRVNHAIHFSFYIYSHLSIDTTMTQSILEISFWTYMGIFQTHISFLLDFNKILVIVFTLKNLRVNLYFFEISYRLREFDFQSRIKLYIKLSNVMKICLNYICLKL